MTLPAPSTVRLAVARAAEMDGRLFRDVVLTGFDLETTGPDPAADYIVQTAAVRIEGGAARRGEWLTYPGIPIPKGASDVHGVTDDRVHDAPLFVEVADEIMGYFDGADAAVAYNGVRFDAPLLNRELATAQRPALAAPVLDPFVFLSWTDRHVRPRTLGHFCQLAGIDLLNAHDATADVLATLRLLIAMVKSGRIPPRLEAALAAQRTLATYIEAEFQLYGGRFYDRGDGLRIGFGKHTGCHAGEVPRDYFRYLLRRNPQPDPAARWPHAAHEIIAKLA